MKLEGEYRIQKWEQASFNDSAGLDEATVTIEFSGGITGTGNIRYLMARLPDVSAEFTGLVLVTGAVDNQRGSFVIIETGLFNGQDTAQGDYAIVSGSGSGELSRIRGSGVYVATHGERPIEYGGRSWEPTVERVAAYVMDIELE